MKTPTKDMDTWTTDELLAEVLDRSAGDRPAIEQIRLKTIRALLNDCDQKADTVTQSANPAPVLPSIGQNDESR